LNPLARRRATKAHHVQMAVAKEAQRQAALNVSLALRRNGGGKHRRQVRMETSQQPTGLALDASMPLASLDLSKRTITALSEQNINTVGDLKRHIGQHLLSLANFGKKSLEELQQAGLV
jgi:DNA-directed RNA polymerase alpha subunit